MKPNHFFHSLTDLGPQTEVNGAWYTRREHGMIGFSELYDKDGEPIQLDGEVYAWRYAIAENSFYVDGTKYEVSRTHMTVREIAKTAAVPQNKSIFLLVDESRQIFAKATRGSRISLRPNPIFITK